MKIIHVNHEQMRRALGAEPRARAKRRSSSEYDEQCALFEWAARNAPRYPELLLLVAVPNGEKRDATTGARLKRSGVKAGFPDTILCVARQGFHGYFCELKVKPNTPKPTQEAWLNALSEQGYATDVSYSWQEAARKIAAYLGIEPGEVGL